MGPSWICRVGSYRRPKQHTSGNAAAGVSPMQLPAALPLLLLSQAKFFCAVQGELNCCNSMGALEMHQRLEKLKRSIHRVHLYSQGEAQPLPGSGNPVNLTQDTLSLVLKSSL